MSLNFILVAGPVVRASSWEPTARRLREEGHHVQTPDVLANRDAPPAWSTFTSHLLERITPCSEPILIGHSSAGPLVADLATKLPCRGIIIVDGDIPPLQGAASPGRPALRDFIKSLADADGTLPIYSRWFAGDAQREARVGLDVLARDPVAFAEFENELIRFPADWFDDTIELANWDHIPAGFIQTSPFYDEVATEAQRRGWPVVRLQGTHLHPTLSPAETASAILSISQQLISRGA